MLLRPGGVSLTMLLAVMFFVEGISAIFAGLDFRHHPRNWGWLLFSGVVDLALVYLIWSGWPGTAVWAIGLLVGINLIVTGLSLIMLSFTARRWVALSKQTLSGAKPALERPGRPMW